VRLAVLRASGKSLEPTRFLAAHSLVAEAVWRAGEPDRKGTRRSESGFNVLVSEETDRASFLREVGHFLEQRHAMLTALREESASVELDIGLTVGSEAQFTASVELGPELLERLARSGVRLRVSAYPSSDDEDA
jgi:hypothetical protein